MPFASTGSRCAMAALCCAAALSCAHAQAQAPSAIRTACGGIGSDESDRMRQEMKHHPLALLFARTGGDYLADVQVRIADAGGVPLLEWKADGPVCLIDLPPGRYRVQVRSDRTSREREVTVGPTPVQLDFRF